MTPVWLAFLSGALVGAAVCIAALGIALHWAEIIGWAESIGSVRRDRVRRGCDCSRNTDPCPMCRLDPRVEARRLEVPAVRRRR